MDFFTFLLFAKLIDKASGQSQQTPQSEYLNSLATSSAVLFTATIITFFASWYFISTILLGISCFTFLHGMVIGFSMDCEPKKRQKILSISFIFWFFSIISCEIFFFTSLQWLAKPLFWCGIIICMLYLIGARNHAKQLQVPINIEHDKHNNT